jgi:hypothetical protein
MLTRLVVLVCPCLVAAGALRAQEQLPALQDCSIVASEGLPGAEAASTVGLSFAGDGPERHVVAAAPRSARGPAPATTLRSIRRGVSYGASLAQAAGGGAWEAAFTMAHVEESGTILLETWRWGATGPTGNPPSYAWSRLRCGP